MSKTQQQSRSVRFYEVVQVQEIASCIDFSDKLVNKCWYSREEFSHIRPREPRRTAKCCRGECLRGLETLTKRGSFLRRKQSQLATFAVVDEQQLQRRAQENDPDALAAVYSAQTDRSQREAYIVGLLDELYVRNHVVEVPCSDLEEEISNHQAASKDTKAPVTPKLCTCLAASGATSLKRRKSDPRLSGFAPSAVVFPRKLRRFCSQRLVKMGISVASTATNEE